MKFFDKNIVVTSDIYDAHIIDRSNWFGDVPPFTNLEINICGICNRKCFFCPKANRKLFPNKKEYMSLEFYETLLKELAGVNFKGRLSFCGLSEPLMHRKLLDLVKITKQYCPDCFLDILTNGDFSTVENTQALFEAGLDNMKVSMYDGPEQIPHFTKIRQECGLSDKQFVIRERYLSADKNFGLTINNRGGSVNLQQYNIVPLKEPLKRSCYYPFHKLIIDYDGDVMICPCDWEKKLVVGNLNKNNIFELWDSDVMKDVRLRLINKDRSKPPCTQCDIDGTLYAKLHFEAWVKYYGVRV
jgi:radical SAM protein with 4Fe4S-binding SPASM domain